jgi:hypothetical protein
MTAKSRLLLVVPLLLLPLASCSKGNKNANAHVIGKVTYKGAAVTGGNMLFHAENGGNTPVLLKPDGSFEGTDLPVGEVIVTIDTMVMKTAGGGQQPKYGQGQGQAGSSPMPPGFTQGQGGTYVKIPEKYEKKESSPLKRTLKSGTQTWDMELTD